MRHPCSFLNNIRHRVKMILLWKLVSERRRLRQRNEPRNEVSESTCSWLKFRVDTAPAQATRRKKQVTPEPEPTQQRGDNDGESLYASE